MTITTIRDGEPRTATSTFTQIPSSELCSVQCCFRSTETIRTIRDGEPGMATSTLTQLLGSSVRTSVSPISISQRLVSKYRLATGGLLVGWPSGSEMIRVTMKDMFIVTHVAAFSCDRAIRQSFQ